MSKRRRKRGSVAVTPSSRHPVTPSPRHPVTPSARHSIGSELLRRVLLSLLTALVVARPLLRGEDPGRSFPSTGVADLVLNQLWFLAAAGWALWRLWSRQSDWHGSLVEVGLLIVVASFGMAAGWAAHYAYPAWNITWEWITIFVSFFLIRQLVRSPDDNQELLAAVLATGVTVAAFAVYQAIVEMPAGHPVRATFVQPGTFAGYLVLLLPILVGTWLVSLREEAGSWYPRLIAVAVLLLLAALTLTQSVAAFVALIVIGVGFLIGFWRRLAGIQRGLCLVALSALAGLGWLVAPSGPELVQVFWPIDSWKPAWAMCDAHSVLGVGPGNYTRHLPQFLQTPVNDRLADPHNFLLELASTCGIGAAIALLLTLGLYFWYTWKAVPETEIDDADGTRQTKWEFYLGGVTGLILAFMLRAGSLGQDEILHEGLVAGVRSLVWFIAFAVLEDIPWSGVDRARALAVGVAGLLLYSAVTGGLLLPALAQPLWVAIALGLNAAVPKPLAWPKQSWLISILPLPIFTAVAVAYCLMISAPGIAAARLLNEVRSYTHEWRTTTEPEWRRQMNNLKDPLMKLRLTEKATGYLEANIFKRLAETASIENKKNAATLIQISYWTGKQWEMFAEVRGFDRKDLNDWNREMRKRAKQRADVVNGALLTALKAQQLDPDGKDGYWAEYQLRVIFARNEDTVPATRKQQYGLALEILRKIWDLDPRDERLQAEYNRLTEMFHADVEKDKEDPQLLYLLADVLFQQKDEANGKDRAREALQRDQQTKEVQRKLTDQQRKQLKQWLSQS